jgi:hypothetical protein
VDREDVGALRLSANGWEGWIVEGAIEWLRKHPPGVILLEYSPQRMIHAGYAEPTRLLLQLQELGYNNVAHSGALCVERWRNLTGVMGQSTAAMVSVPQEGVAAVAAWDGSEAERWSAEQRQMVRASAWCRLKQESLGLLGSYVHAHAAPEDVLLIHNSHQSVVVSTQGRAGGSENSDHLSHVTENVTQSVVS